MPVNPSTRRTRPTWWLPAGASAPTSPRGSSSRAVPLTSRGSPSMIRTVRWSSEAGLTTDLRFGFYKTLKLELAIFLIQTLMFNESFTWYFWLATIAGRWLGSSVDVGDKNNDIDSYGYGVRTERVLHRLCRLCSLCRAPLTVMNVQFNWQCCGLIVYCIQQYNVINIDEWDPSTNLSYFVINLLHTTGNDPHQLA